MTIKLLSGLFLALFIFTFMTVGVSKAEAKALVVVFSRTDENYSVGNIAEGNTMKKLSPKKQEQIYLRLSLLINILLIIKSVRKLHRKN